jgi:drug/metabolite transporter (DMT)-like permease
LQSAGLAGPSKVKAILLALLIVFFNAAGNLALAWGMKSQPETVGWSPAGYVRAMLNPFVATGIVLLILWLLTRMALMSWADLSFALPLMSLGYILAAVLGKFVLYEAVSPWHWLGALLIFAGIGIVGTTDHRTEGASGQ